jgi:hypothetical protein
VNWKDELSDYPQTFSPHLCSSWTWIT